MKILQLLKKRDKEFDKLFPNDFCTERNLTIEEMQDKKTYYTKELVTVKQFFHHTAILLIKEMIKKCETEQTKVNDGWGDPRRYGAHTAFSDLISFLKSELSIIQKL